MGGGSPTARLAPPHHGGPHPCQLQPRMGGGSPAARLASTMYRWAPIPVNYNPRWVVVAPPPVLHRHIMVGPHLQPRMGGGATTTCLTSTMSW